MKLILFFLLIGLNTIAAIAQSNTLIPYRVKDKWGYSDTAGNLIIEAKYQDANFFYYSRAVVKLNNEWKIINGQEVVVYESKTDSIDKRYYSQSNFVFTSFAKSRQPVIKIFKGNISVYLDTLGNGVKEIKEDGFGWGGEAVPYPGSNRRHSKAIVVEQADGNTKKYGYINKEVNILAKYDSIVPIYFEIDTVIERQNRKFKTNLKMLYFIVKKDEMFGIINDKDSVVVDFEYEDIKKFKENYFWAKKDKSRWASYTLGGENIIPPLYSFHSPMRRNRLIVSKAGKYGLLSSKNEILIPLSQDTMFIEQGYYKVVNDNRNSLYTHNGKLLVSDVYDNYQIIYHNIVGFIVEKDNKFGYLNSAGTLVIPMIYDKIVNPGSKSFFICSKKKKKGLIDHKGGILLENKYFEILEYHGAYFKIRTKKGKIGYVNTSGRSYFEG